MARDSLQARLVLERLHCFDEGDGWGSVEPYLWTVFFKVDGDTVALGDDLLLRGHATVIPTPGSHGNLGDAQVDHGDDVRIPSAVGELVATLRPIPVPAWLTERTGVADMGGILGVATVLMEEDGVSDAGAEAGHAALDAYVRLAIDGVLPSLGPSLDREHSEVTEADLQALTAGVQGALAEAIETAQGGWEELVSWLDADDRIGHHVFTFGHDELATLGSHDFSHRWADDGDWQLHGHVTASPTCPAEATVAVLQALGLAVGDEGVRCTTAIRAFARRHFAGCQELGAWWRLAQRNTASITRVLRADPETARALIVPLVQGLSGAAQAPAAPLPEAVFEGLESVLRLLVAHGNRRLRIDAKAALRVLPRVRGRTRASVAAVLAKEPPTRKPERIALRPMVLTPSRVLIAT